MRRAPHAHRHVSAFHLTRAAPRRAQVCRETAPNVMDVERSLKDRINFVMLNVDNAKARTHALATDTPLLRFCACTHT